MELIARAVAFAVGRPEDENVQADARATLARPFDDRLFFAGEATHATDFSTTHGAYESGVRAAEEAIAHLRRTPSGTRVRTAKAAPLGQ